MGSRARRVTTTKGALQPKNLHLDRMNTRDANIIRMLYGLDEAQTETVGEPPEGCSPETIKKLHEVEQRILRRARSRRPYSRPESIKRKIVMAMKKKP